MKLNLFLMGWFCFFAAGNEVIAITRFCEGKYWHTLFHGLVSLGCWFAAWDYFNRFDKMFRPNG
jgi:pentatricopeptide repeat protein